MPWHLKHFSKFHKKKEEEEEEGEGEKEQKCGGRFCRKRETKQRLQNVNTVNLGKGYIKFNTL